MRPINPQVILIIVLLFTLGLVSCGKESHYDIGLKSGKLRPCSQDHLCLSTLDGGQSQDVRPLKYLGDLKKSRENLKLVLTRIGIKTLLQENEHYLAYRLDGSPLQGEVILEFLFNDQEQLVHMKSSAQRHFLDFSSPAELLNKISFEYYQN